MADQFGGALSWIEVAGTPGQVGDLVAEHGELFDAGVEVVGVLMEQVLNVAAGCCAVGAEGQDLADLAEGEPDGLGCADEA